MKLFSNKEDRAGLYLTVIFHLTVIIVLLLYSIDSTIRREESFVLDFSKQEEIERKEKEEIFKEDISRKLEYLFLLLPFDLFLLGEIQYETFLTSDG